MSIRSPDFEAVHAAFKTTNMESLRINTWADLEALNAQVYELEKQTKDIFVKKMIEARDDKTLCYYQNENGALCRGYVVDIDDIGHRFASVICSGPKFYVKMRDADFPEERPSAFDKHWVWWPRIWQIGELK